MRLTKSKLRRRLSKGRPQHNLCQLCGKSRFPFVGLLRVAYNHRLATCAQCKYEYKGLFATHKTYIRDSEQIRYEDSLLRNATYTSRELRMKGTPANDDCLFCKKRRHSDFVVKLGRQSARLCEFCYHHAKTMAVLFNIGDLYDIINGA